VIQYDAAHERALQHVCGNALVCDSLEIARSVCYDRGQEVKAVTLDGTIIHKSGMMTGGTSASDRTRHFEDREVEGKFKSSLHRGLTFTEGSSWFLIGLRRREAELKAKLAEIHKAKPRGNPDDVLLSEMTRLGAELTLVRDDLVRRSSLIAFLING
jgi:structural maintenance of chromosome 1